VSKPKPTYVILEGRCAGKRVCPLSCVKAGSVVCIKEISGAPELQSRLREMGLIEEQTVKLVSSQSNIICQVCNARLGISRQVARSILVEALPGQMEAA
jgi:Fe2+ transport system protein FeoA